MSSWECIPLKIYRLAGNYWEVELGCCAVLVADDVTGLVCRWGDLDACQ